MLKQKSRWSSGKTLASHTNSPRFESRLGQCRYGSCVLLAKVAPRPSDETLNRGPVWHAFKFMRGLRRTWMTKQKSKGSRNRQMVPTCRDALKTECDCIRAVKVEKCHVSIVSWVQDETLQASR